MNRSIVGFSLFVLSVMIGAATPGIRAQERGGNNPEAQAARQKQLALEAATPKLQITEEHLTLRIPGHTIGETEGVSKNSKGHLFVYSRTGNGGSARGGTAAQLFEFDENLKFVKQWGPDNYAASFAHSVRVDSHDNVWMVDEGSSMIVKFDPDGNVRMTLGRKPEAIDYLERFVERGEKINERFPVGNMGTFNRQTDIAFDAQDNMYVSDGYGNSRFVKIAKDGTWIKVVGTRGNGQDQFNTPHGIAVDKQAGLVYVADRGNQRIQVYDTDMNFKKSITGVAAPWSVQVTPRYIYSGDGTGKIYQLDHNGKLLGWGQVGLGLGQTGCIIHELHAESDNVLYKGACSQWEVEKLTIRGTSSTN
ncbi:MAG TPA: 6-bladed beta-propeller [Terriglobia bacterium]|nr:6-bladed beta-propeller [Terriglobia bacterium]